MLIILLILAGKRFILWLYRRILKRQVRKKYLDIVKSHALYQLGAYILWVIAITVSMETAGIKITILLAGPAALLVGLGLGLQQVFKDFISGLFLLFEGHIKVGNIFELGSNIGRVKEIGLQKKLKASCDLPLIKNSGKAR